MVQLAYVLAGIVVGGAVVMWGIILYKLLPLYRAGAVQGGYRAAFQVAIALLSWVTMQIVVWLFMHQDALAMMLTVLWAIGLLSWLTVSTVAQTRRQVRSETAQAQPAPQPVSQAAPDVSRYTVRRAPHTAAASGVRSSRVRRIQSMEEQYGD